MRSACLLLLVSLAAFADTVVLKTGYRVEAEQVVRDGERVRIVMKSGALDVLADEIAEIILKNPPKPAVTTPAPVLNAATDIERMLIAAAYRHNLPPEFVLSVARAESGLRPDARSHKGAIGVMQLMPETARSLGADPYDVAQNIEAGVKLLGMLVQRYDRDGPLALAAYNAGMGSVARYGGIPPYAETRRYINRIMKLYDRAAGTPAKR